VKLHHLVESPPSSQHVERISGARELNAYPEHLARYRFAMQWAPNARILDVCCGVGYGSMILAAGGAAQVQGIDISRDAIDAAWNQPSLPNLRFSLGDACKPYPAPGTWHLVTCFEGIEHVPDPAALLRSVYDALQPGGIAIVSTPNARGYEGGDSNNPFHISEMDEPQFRGLVNQFDWSVEWYAQISKQSVWKRPKWQQSLIRMIPGPVRRWRQQRAYSQKPPEVWTGVAVDDLWQTDTDDWYPIPWETALRIMYNPPPIIVLAVCRKLPAAHRRP